MRALLLLVTLAACSPSLPDGEEVEGPDVSDKVFLAEEAFNLSPAPTIRWFAGERLSYQDSDIDDENVVGMFLYGFCYVEIHIAADSAGYQDTLAHELCHWEAWERRDGGNSDDHEEPEFKNCIAMLLSLWE